MLVGNRGESSTTPVRSCKVPGLPAGSSSTCASCFSATPGFGRLTYLDPNAKQPRMLEIEGRTGRASQPRRFSGWKPREWLRTGSIAADVREGSRLEAELINPHGRVRRFEPGATEIGCTAGLPSFTATVR